MEEVKILNFYPWIEPLIANVMQEDMGLCAGKVTLKDIFSSCHPSIDNTEKNDMFTVCIPYAGATIQWQVIFNGSDEEELPDFLIPEHDGFDPEYEDIPALINWNSTDPSSLLNVLKDILRLHKAHHLQLLAKTEDKLAKDVQDLIALNEYPFVDTLVVKDEENRYGNTQDVLSVLIQIRVDFSEIPDSCYKDAPSIDPYFTYPVLFIKTVAQSGKIRPLLYMSPRMEHVLGGRNAMKLPPYNYQSTILRDYTQSVQRNIQSLINILKEGRTKRREYVAAFLIQCPGSVLEYDAADFSTISLLFTHEDFYFIVHVTLGAFFPQEQPPLTFQSVYHVTKRGALYRVVHSTYPYSPRWQGNEMVKRARSYILEQVSSFRTGCLKNGTI